MFWPRNDLAPLLRWHRHCVFSVHSVWQSVCWTAWVSPSLVIHRVFATTVQHPVSRLYCAEFLRTPYLDPFSSYAADVFQLVEGSGLTAHVYANDLQICDYTDPQHSAELRTRLAEVINWRLQPTTREPIEDRNYLALLILQMILLYCLIPPQPADRVRDLRVVVDKEVDIRNVVSVPATPHPTLHHWWRYSHVDSQSTWLLQRSVCLSLSQSADSSTVCSQCGCHACSETSWAGLSNWFHPWLAALALLLTASGLLVYKCLHGPVADHLAQSVHVRYCLTLLLVLSCILMTISLAFCSSDPVSWNTLPTYLCLPSRSLDCFRKHLKT